MLFMILTAIIAVLVAVLALQNSMMVDLTLFMWSFRLNLVLVVLISVICGFLIAMVWGIKVKTQSLWKQRKLNEQIALLEDDKRILREKVEKMLKEQNGANPADITATPAPAVTPATPVPGPANPTAKKF